MQGLILFDLDGTLYRGDAPFRFYAKTIARFMPPADAHRYLERVEDHLQGVKGIVEGDNWEAVVHLAQPYIWDDDQWTEAFRKTREFMAGDDCELEMPDGLREFLREARGRVTLACASNSPPEAAYTLLKKLDLADAFDHIAANVNKPEGLIAQASMLWGGNILPQRTLSVGDNYQNDIAPALAAGWQTAHISPHGYFPGPSSVHGHTMEDVLPFLANWVAELPTLSQADSEGRA